jgi:cell division protein FtsW
LLTGLAALPVLALFVIGADYRLRRLIAFLDPWKDASNSGFQIIQSYIAFGSGQFWGLGLGQSRQKLFYLPEAHTDFIFSVIGEELGLLGALIVLALFGFIILRGLRLALRIDEPFGQYLAFGLTSLLGLQALIHMGVVMGLMPTKGLVLPFISYGGSAMVMNLTEAGILLSLSRRRT